MPFSLALPMSKLMAAARLRLLPASQKQEVRAPRIAAPHRLLRNMIVDLTHAVFVILLQSMSLVERIMNGPGGVRLIQSHEQPSAQPRLQIIQQLPGLLLAALPAPVKWLAADLRFDGLRFADWRRASVVVSIVRRACKSWILRRACAMRPGSRTGLSAQASL